MIKILIKVAFIKTKKLFSLNDIDVNKILVSKTESYATKSSSKYFIGYNDGDVIRPLCIILPQMIGYVKHFDSNKTMSFEVSDNKLLKKYNKIWEKISNLLDIKSDSQPVYGDGDKYTTGKCSDLGHIFGGIIEKQNPYFHSTYFLHVFFCLLK